MGLEKTACLVARCDVCRTIQEHDYIPHYASESEAHEGLENDEWQMWEGHIWCYNCDPPCACGHGFGDHDFGEAPCQDCSCQGYAWKEVSEVETSKAEAR
jgi:hypothetical protein